MRLREATAADTRDIYAVHTAAIVELAAAAYDQEVVDAWAGAADPSLYDPESEDVYFVVAVEDSRVLGFGSLCYEPSVGYGVPIDGEITAVYVHPDNSRQGVGSGLLDALETEARESRIETVGLTSSVNAVPFYEFHGYERTREISYSFGDTVEGPAVEMVKRI